MKMDENNGKELKNEELEQVTGGWYVESDTFKTKEEVVFKWNVNAHVEIVTAYFVGHVFTKGCTVLAREAREKEGTNGFCAWYLVSSIHSDYNNKWYQEDSFEHGYNTISPVFTV